MNKFPPFVLFSAELSDRSEIENRDRTALLAGALSNRGIDWKPVRGVYKGHEETSFLVWTHEGTETADLIEDLATRYGQESILYVDADRLAYLLYLSPRRVQPIGKWQLLSDLGALITDAYTCFNGECYAAF